MSGARSILLDPAALPRVQEALREVEVDGWLLHAYKGCNPVASTLVGLGEATRRSFAFIPASGVPVALTHRVDVSLWSAWPFELRDYVRWGELEEALGALLEGRVRIATEVSPGGRVPSLDRLPAGIASFLLGLGLELVSSGDLVSRFHSVWTPTQRADHRRAAELLAGIARAAFDRLGDAAHEGRVMTEREIADWVRGAQRRVGLTTSQDCIVAAGPSTADPHYTPAGEGRVIERGSLVLLDLWGALPGSVPADQTWMAALGSSLDPRTQAVWEAVRDARDASVAFLGERHALGREVRGYEVDRVARALIEERGFGPFFVHRTGHSIDTELHGSGPNLDDLESRDDRILIPGVGFSIEPGIYLPGEFGIRSEINVQWTLGGPEVTPLDVQEEILLLLP